MQYKITFFFSLLLLASPFAHAGIYKWTDDQGNVHYSQTKPSNQKAESLRIKSHAPTDKSTYKRPSLNVKDKDNQAADTDAQAEKSNEPSPQQKAEMCKRSRADLQILISQGQVRQKRQDGTVVYMTDEQKQKRIAAERKRIEKYCK